MEFTYLTQPPKRYTFQQPKLREWTEQQCKGKVLSSDEMLKRLKELEDEKE